MSVELTQGFMQIKMKYSNNNFTQLMWVTVGYLKFKTFVDERYFHFLINLFKILWRRTL